MVFDGRNVDEKTIRLVDQTSKNGWLGVWSRLAAFFFDRKRSVVLASAPFRIFFWLGVMFNFTTIIVILNIIGINHTISSILFQTTEQIGLTV